MCICVRKKYFQDYEVDSVSVPGETMNPQGFGGGSMNASLYLIERFFSAVLSKALLMSGYEAEQAV